MTSAENQQERSETTGWVVGFVDGEGTFSVSIFKNKTTKRGWQVFPEFIVTQGSKSRASLEDLQQFFDCGRILVNHRFDNHQEDLYRYCVRSLEDLRSKIIPFFINHPLRTAKKADFKTFCEIINLIEQKKHLDLEGLKEIAQLTYKMNDGGAKSFLKSSETIRQTPI